MSDKYRLSVQIDEATKTLIARAIGPMPGPELMDAFYHAYAKLDQPWLYKRLVDYRNFTGTLDYADVARFAERWAGLIGDSQHNSKVAVVTHDALELARVSTMDELFPYDQVRSFPSVDEALDWLNEA